MDPRARDGEMLSSLLPPEQDVVALPVSVSRATIFSGALAPKAVFPSVRYLVGYNAFRGGSVASDTSDLSIPVGLQCFLLLLCPHRQLHALHRCPVLFLRTHILWCFPFEVRGIDVRTL